MLSETSQQLLALSREIIANPCKVDELSPEEITELRKFMNPLGNIIRRNEKFAVMSITNFTERWTRRMTITSLIGYIYRLAHDYEPDIEIDRETQAYNIRLAEASTEEQKNELKSEYKKKCDTIRNSARGLIKRFLDRNFEYNPDKHIRVAHKPYKPELIKEKINTAVSREEADHIRGVFAQKPEKTVEYLASTTMATYQILVESIAALKSCVAPLGDLSVFAPDGDPSKRANLGDVVDKCMNTQAIILKNLGNLSGRADDIRRLSDPLCKHDVALAQNIAPPADVFYHFERYMSNNYEHLREVCEKLYLERPDIEDSVVFYDSFATEDDANVFIREHEAEFKNSAIVVRNNGVVLLGPFQSNRDKLEFYNKNTDLLREMNEQLSADHKLARDIMRKRATDKKRENIARDGPDAEGLAAYSSAINTISEFGAKPILTKEEKRELERAIAIKEDAEVPDDALQVDIFYPVEDGDSARLERSKMYTQAEIPLHLQPNSEYAEEYQPPRPDGVSLREITKTIKSRDGKMLTIDQVKRHVSNTDESSNSASSNSTSSNSASSNSTSSNSASSNSTSS